MHTVILSNIQLTVSSYIYLVVIAETEDLIKRLNEWKDNVENRDMNKTKVVISWERQKVTQKAVRWP